MVKFRIFNRQHEIRKEITYKTIFGNEAKSFVRERLYENIHEVYEAAAKFASEQGSRLITISGMAWADVPDGYLYGDVVVWYHEETK
jgi:hypothetical protein